MTHMLRTVCSLVFVLLAASFLRADLISYEGCDYPVTNGVAGLNGGKGWDGAWYQETAGQDAFSVIATGFTYSDGSQNLAVRGGAFKTVPRVSGGTLKRKVLLTPDLAPLLTNGSYFGLAGTTNWLSFLARVDGDLLRIVGSSTNYLGSQALELNKAPNALMENFERAFMGARPSLLEQGTRVLSNKWVIGGFGGYTPNNGLYTGTVDIVSGQAVFYVARFIYGAPTPSNMLATMWINPALSNEPSDESGLTPPAWSMMWKFQANPPEPRDWNAIAINGAIGAAFTNNPSYGYLDEIRIGTSFRDVAPRDFEEAPIVQPVNISPTDGAQNVALPVTLTASAFSSAPGDVHSQSRFTVTSQDGATLIIVTGALTSISLDEPALKLSTKYTWSVQYKGTNSPAWSDPSVGTVFTLAAPATSTLIAYDGCAYPETPFPYDIHSYGSGSGFLGNWRGAYVGSGFMRVESLSPGLFYQFGLSPDYLLVTNNRFHTTWRGKDWDEGSEERVLASSRATRRLGTDGAMHLITPSNTFGKIGTTNWFSFLARYESGDTSQRYGVSLNVGYDGNVPYQFFMGKPAGQSTWGIMGMSNVTAASTVDATDGSTALLVTRVIYDNPGATVHMWVNPPTRTQPLEATAGVVTNVPRFEFDYVDVMANGVGESPLVGLDEFRLGTDWDAVMPLGPPPPKFVGTPTNVAPADAATGVSLTSLVQASAFNGAGDGDLHIGSQFKFVSLGAVERLVSTGGLTAIQLPEGILDPATRYTWQVRYLGTNTATWSDWSEPTSFTTVPGAPRLIAYDGAGYEITNRIGGRTGGFGWSASWAEQTWNTLPPGTYYFTQIAVTNPGLEYADLIVTNHSFMTTPWGWTYGGWGNTDQTPFSRNSRPLALDANMHLVNPNNTFGKPGTTNWLSFLARLDSGTPGDYGIEFVITNAPNSEGLLAVGCVPDTGYLGAWVPGTSPLLSTVSSNPANDSTAFIVACVIFGAAEDTLHLWVNPPLGAAPPAVPSATLTAIPHVEFSRLGLRASGSPTPYAALDELRFGETWESVTPIIPEPAALIVLLALPAFRRRT